VIAIADGGQLKTMRLDKADVVKTKSAGNIRDMDFMWDAQENEVLVYWIDAVTKTIKLARLSNFLDQPKSRVRRASREKDIEVCLLFGHEINVSVFNKFRSRVT
jgi:hypothetical protein